MSTADPRYTVHQGDVRQVLKSLPAESVHMCCTSPPYWALRSYLEAGHEHKSYELGNEATVGEYISNMVAVFEDVKRVLRRDGTCWVNIGDSYAGGPSGSQGGTGQRANRAFTAKTGRTDAAGIPAKNLCLIPQRLAISLQDAGWWVRSIIIWDKSNPMPESVTDRPTTSHEYVLMLAKSANYYYDSEAIREPAKPWNNGLMRAPKLGTHRPSDPYGQVTTKQYDEIKGANRRTVWRIPSHSFEGAHFATFPPALVEPMIKAATSERGCCPSCMAPWRRTVAATAEYEALKASRRGTKSYESRGLEAGNRFGSTTPGLSKATTTTGWQPTCKCSTDAPLVPAVVLDCFSGASTTGLVALRLGRHYVGIELNPEYIEMSHRRIEADAGANQMHMSLEETA